MLVYILKFSACLAIFLAFYKLFLERENMHQFKRFYLLGSILTSMAIPFVTFTTYIESQPIVDGFNSTVPLSSEVVSTTIENPTNYLPIIIWSIYGVGVLLFGLKFGFNLAQMILKIKKNPKLKTSNFINVLLNDLVSPHTFFSYIFLNKHKYETHQIPQSVLLHEQTHAKQKHSIDILLIELLQIVFWFNPLIRFAKKSIKLNHEFLADNAVLSNGIEANNYQHILLSFSSYNDDVKLANAINYSSIKKRITVMKTQTSQKKIWLRTLVLLPLLALTLYGFSDRIEIIEEKNQLDLLQKNNNLSIEKALESVSEKQDGASREQMKEYERLAKHYNSLPKDQLIIKKEDLERMKYIYHLMSAKQKKDTEPFPVLPPPPPPPAPEADEPKANELESTLPPPPPPPIPENATKEQKEQYKKVIEEYKRKYTIEDGKVYENPPPPPPPIPENATEPQRKKYEEAIRLYRLRTQENKLARSKELKEEKLAHLEARNQKLKTEKRELAQVRELSKKEDVLRLRQEKLAYAEAQKARLSTDERLARVREIEPPKPPRSPLDHIVDMAKKDATFYLEGKEISSDEAIKVLKENKHLNIQTLDSSSKQPKVYITKKPIVIDN